MTLPLVEELTALDTDAARAAWLLRYPVGHLPATHLNLKAVLSGAGFMAGARYVDEELAAALAVRLADGELPQTIRIAREYWRSRMREIARGNHG